MAAGRQGPIPNRLPIHAQLIVVSARKQDRRAQWIEQAGLKALKPKAESQRIEQLPRIGPVLELVGVLESGAFARFPSAGDYACYCRKVNSQRWSTDNKKGPNNRRCGHRYLAWGSAEAAGHAIRCDPRTAAW